MVAIIDLCDERAVLVLVNCDDQPITMQHVPLLPENLGGQSTKNCQLLIVQIEVCACDFSGSLTEANLVPQLANDGGIVLAYFAQPQSSPRHLPIDDLLRAYNAVGGARKQEPTLALDNRVLQ